MLSTTDALADTPHAAAPNELINSARAVALDSALAKRGAYAYAFATQGLDLAIPSRQTWLASRGRPICRIRSVRGVTRKMCRKRKVTQHHRNWSSGVLTHTFIACPAPLLESTSWLWWPTRIQQLNNSDAAVAGCTNERLSNDRLTIRRIWYSHDDSTRAEAACAEIRCGQQHEQFQPVCTTRVLPGTSGGAQQSAAIKRSLSEVTQGRRVNPQQAVAGKNRRQLVRTWKMGRGGGTREMGKGGGGKGAGLHGVGLRSFPTRLDGKKTEELRDGKEEDGPKRTNLLLVLLDAVSRAEFEESLPLTSGILKRRKFARFDQHTAVGPNSGPNQVGLYLGQPLDNRTVASLRDMPWLWDSLRAAGYTTLKGEDSCVLNSNMMASTRPRTTHGKQLERLFCYSYARPNCLGSASAAEMMLNYTEQYMAEYTSDTTGAPWAAMVHIASGHEDSQTVVGTLDEPLFSFFERLHLTDTLVVVTSDHGSHTRETRTGSLSPCVGGSLPCYTRHEAMRGILLGNPT